mgnify:CR=1 FL=1
MNTLNLKPGQLTLADLRARHQGVIWAGGAPTDRQLALPGFDLPGVSSATSFVGWYNGHPDFADLDVDLDTERVVVVGNGNVALDVARILVADPGTLAATDISRPALAKLRSSSVREVVVMGRRGPAHAAFTLPELIGLVDSGVPVTVDAADLEVAPAAVEWDVQIRVALPRGVRDALGGGGQPGETVSTSTPVSVTSTMLLKPAAFSAFLVSSASPFP